jgi:mono/diheme cytochrome c family protein
MMKRLLRWIGIALGSLAALALIAYAVVYILSERVLRRTYDVPSVAISIPTDPASIIEGRRLAIVRGCFGGCHGREVEGVVMIDQPMIGRVVAPNLTAAVRKYSDAELAVIIEHGVRPDGRSMMVMPAEAFVWLTDQDLGRIIAFLKSLPAVDGPGPSVSLGPIARIGVAVGKFNTVAGLIAATVPPPEATSEEATHGRYLARTTCPQCHGTSLRGDSNPDFTSPDLRIVASYSAESFAQLMRTGVAPGGRNLPTMGPWARQHLSYLTDAEIAALYSYLHSMPEAARN